MKDHLIAPHGGELVNLIVDDERATELKAASRDFPSWDLTERQICDLELLLVGGFSPLRGFMNKDDYDACLKDMRLADGNLWPMPITLNVSRELAEGLSEGDQLALRDPEGVMLAVLTVGDVWEIDREAEAEAVFGTLDTTHPGVAHLMERTTEFAVGGTLEGIEPPQHYDYRMLRLTPEEVRHDFALRGWRHVVAFQTRNPMHRAHYELTLQASREHDATLLIHPVVGMTKPGDLDHYTRVRCYQAMREHYPPNAAKLALLPLAMRMAGPREAVWHAIIRKNYGCSHFIIGRDHAGPGNGANGEPFYGPYDAQELMREHEEELGVTLVPFQMMVYVEDRDRYMPIDEVPEGSRQLNLSGTQLRNRLADGRDIPSWFTFPEVATELRRTHPPRAGQRLHDLLHRPVGLGQVDDRSRPSGEVPGDGRPPRDSAGWGHRAQEPLFGARLLEGASRPQRLSYRLRRFGDHQERRHRGLCPDRSLRRRPQGRAWRPSSRSAASSWSIWTPRSRSVSSATARVSTRRRERASSRSSPASRIRTRSPRTPRW